MLKRILRMVRLITPYKFRLFLVLLAGVIYAGANVGFVKVGDFTAKIIQSEVEGFTASQVFPESILSLLGLENITRDQSFCICIGLMAFCMMVLSFAVYYRRFLGEWLGYRVVVDTQAKLARHLLELDYDYFQKQRMGELLSRLTNDLFLLTRTVLLLCIFFTRPIQLISLMIALFWINWQLTLYSLIGAPFAVLIFAFLSKKIRHSSRGTQRQMANVADSLVRFLSGINTVKAFACENFEYRLFQKQNESYFDEVIKREKAISLERPIVSAATKFGVLVVFFVSGGMILKGVLTISDFAQFIIALALMFDPMKELSRGNSELQVALPGAERVFELMDVAPTKRCGGRVLKDFKRTIDFKNVGFSYVEDTEVIKDFSVKINKGETIALVGPSGSGKSTLINLLLRFFDVRNGSILIDGFDIRDYSISSLRGQMALVSQNPFLFNTTIKDNIAYGRENVSLESIIEAAMAANIHDEILNLPDGYDTVVGERGEMLSGGQRQRVTIARAIFKNPPILLLDEATSALDSESEKLVQTALESLMSNRTSIVIAHRLSTIRNADRIIVLSDGEILDIGRHDQLLESCPEYAHLYQLQIQSASDEVSF